MGYMGLLDRIKKKLLITFRIETITVHGQLHTFMGFFYMGNAPRLNGTSALLLGVKQK